MNSTSQEKVILARALVILMSCIGASSSFAQTTKVEQESEKKFSQIGLMCHFKNAYVEGTVGKNGEQIPDGGGFDAFMCKMKNTKEKSISLNKKKFVAGYVETKDFGKIKSRFSAEGALVMYATSTQEEQLTKFLRQE